MLRISRLKAFVSVFALLPVLGFAIPEGQAAPPAKAAPTKAAHFLSLLDLNISSMRSVTT